jgi:predicted HTH transcriptional regulator
MYADANLASPVDGRILKNYSKEDLDEESIKQYRRLFEVANPDHVWSTVPEDEFLEKINVFRTDGKTGEKGLTYAGLLMFGTYSAIMDENPNFFPDYKEIENPKDRRINRIYPIGNWESNLFQFYRRVLPILQGFLPKPFRLEGNQRINDTPAHVAVREALTNLCIHADHTENATLNVYKYSNKIVFSNPGTMLISPAQYYKGGESICRNKYLQTMFMFLGSSEKAGSGTDKILHGWEKQNWKKPYIMERSRPNKVMLTMPLESLMDEHVIEALNLHFGKKMEGLSRQQLTALALAYSEEEITNERLQHVLDMHRADITTMLSDMCTQQLLESYGYGRGTKYHVYGLNIGLPKNNIGLNASSIGLQDSNTGLGNSSIGLKKKRYSKEEIRKNILDVCQDWRTAEEIATAVGRKVLYIRDIVLPQLSDVIEKMYDIPHHPRQK